MDNYLLKELEKDKYYVICLDYNSILNYINEIENENSIKSNKGELIVDQLLVAGNGRNRFLSCMFDYGKIKLDSAKNIEGTYEYRKLTTDIIRKIYNKLRYSILTDSQLEKIREGQVV